MTGVQTCALPISNDQYGVYSYITDANKSHINYAYFGNVTYQVDDAKEQNGVRVFVQRMDANGNYLKKGNTYGLRGSAEGGATAYGVYGYADEATTNWAGYFVGNVKATGTVTDSDIRLKKDIETLCGSLEKVLRLRGVSYYWKNREEMAAAKGVTADSMDYGFDNRKHIGVKIGRAHV